VVTRLLTLGVTALALVCSFAATAQEADELATADVARDANPASESAIAQTASVVLDAAVTVANTFQGRVSYYGREFAGRRTASGERFDPATLTMAHKTLAFGTLVRVTNLRNNRSVVVRVNDRGPFVASRVADLSASAARLLGMLSAGLAQARFEVLGTARGHPTDDDPSMGVSRRHDTP